MNAFETKATLGALAAEIHESLPEFQRRKSDFYKCTADLTLYLGLCETKSTTADNCRFSVWCGIYSHLVELIYCGRVFRKPDRIKQPDCVISVEVQDLASEQGYEAPNYWTINPTWSALHKEQTTRELRLVISEYALPFLCEFRSIKDILRFLNNPAPKRGSTAMPRRNRFLSLEYSAILNAYLGDFNRATELIDEAITATKVPASKDHMLEVRQRLIDLAKRDVDNGVDR